MKASKTFSFLALAIGLGANAFGKFGQDSRVVQQPKDFLERRVSIRGLEKITIEDVFREALSSANVPGGIVLQGDCAKEVEYELHLPSNSLRQVLDSMVSAAPSYRWQFKDGVVNLVGIRDGTVLLDLNIKKFEVKNAKTLSGAYDHLMNLSEVKQRLAEANITQVRQEVGLTDLGRSGSRVDESEEGFNVSCSNVRFQEALNAIVRAKGSGVWAYSERRCNGRDEISIDFIVQ